MSESQIVPRGQDVTLHPERQMPDAGPSFTFQDLQRMAASVAKSGLFGVKDADQALALMLIAQAQGQHPALVARDFDIIQGRPAKKSEAILRDFQASGGRIEWIQRDDTAAIALFSHPLAPKPLKISWDLERAKKAGLLDKNGGMYVKFARQMLSARCISEGCRATAPQTTTGYYTAEEVMAMSADDRQPVSMTAAVEQAVTAPALTEIEARIDAMANAPDLKSLEAVFSEAWKSTRDADIRARYQVCYNDMKLELTPRSEPTS